MIKVRDRLQLGMMAGLAGVVAKDLVGGFMTRSGLSKGAGPQRAAGRLLPAYKTHTPLGQAAGWLADATVGSLLGIATVYTLTFTGRDRAFLKGLTTGALAWVGLYGVLSNMGATDVRNVQPKTVLRELLGHLVYGVVTASTAVALGDEDLFSGGIPWSASSLRVEEVPLAPLRRR